MRAESLSSVGLSAAWAGRLRAVSLSLRQSSDKRIAVSVRSWTGSTA